MDVHRKTWEERFVDRSIDDAWGDLRLKLGDRFAAGLDLDGSDVDAAFPIDIEGPDGQILTAEIADGHVLVNDGEIRVSANADEAAHIVIGILREEWEVLHPLYLDCELVDVPRIEDNPIGLPAHVGRADLHVGRACRDHSEPAESVDELRAWAVATFSEGRTEPVKVDKDGDICWRTKNDFPVVVRFLNHARIEIYTILARDVDPAKAHRTTDRLSATYVGWRFFVRKGALFMSMTLDADPFVPEHLTRGTGASVTLANRLAWVGERLTDTAEDTASQKAEIADLRRQLRRLQRTADRRKTEREAAREYAMKLRGERNAARARLAALDAVPEPGSTGDRGAGGVV